MPVSLSGAEGQHIVAGYSDGTLRVFSVSRTEMELKMHPHSVAVMALGCSADGKRSKPPWLFRVDCKNLGRTALFPTRGNRFCASFQHSFFCALAGTPEKYLAGQGGLRRGVPICLQRSFSVSRRNHLVR